ncbi:MAG: M20 metallopeptidase family protein [Bacillota bacterium]
MSLLKRASAIEEEMIAIRRKIHENPELAFKEFQTTALLEKELKSYGIETRRNGDQTGLTGVLKGAKPGKVIGVRGDIDALPVPEDTGLPFSSKVEGVSHACGHDINCTTVLACARLLSELKDELSGTVKFIFQPAEETLSGAASMIKNGVMEDPKMDAIICVHTWPEMPGGSIGVRRGAMFAASDRFKITIRGQGGHAAHPHRSIDPVVVAGYLITQLQTIVSREVAPLDSAVVTVGKMTAGTASNIIPNEAVLEGTVRTLNKETRKRVHESLVRIATHTAEGLSATAQVEYVTGVPPLVNDDFLNDLVSAATVELLGEDNLLEVPVASMGSEDFAEYMEFIPGAAIRIGTYDERPESKGALHNSKTVFSEKAIMAGAVMLTGTVFKFTGSDFSKLL